VKYQLVPLIYSIAGRQKSGEEELIDILQDYSLIDQVTSEVIKHSQLLFYQLILLNGKTESRDVFCGVIS
jgi:hypothetical protein